MTFVLDAKKLDAHIAKASFYYDIAGLAVGIGTGDQGLIYTSTNGHKNLNTQEKMSEDTPFHMASVTKLFTSTAILLLQEKGDLHLDDPVTSHLPWFHMADQRYKEITIRQLMTHTSGMPDCMDYEWDQPQLGEDALMLYIKSDEVAKAHLLWDPAAGKFAYSNIGYEILGAVIAAVSGMSYEAYVDEAILKPLGMTDSTLLTFSRDMTKVASPHYKDQANRITVSDIFPYNRAHAPSSTLTSNLADLSKWAMAILNRKLMTVETYEAAWKNYAVVPNNGENIGLGWFIREQNGYRLYGHEGTDDGFRASFWLCPQLDLFISVHANMTGAPVKKISKQIFDLLLGLDPKL